VNLDTPLKKTVGEITVIEVTCPAGKQAWGGGGDAVAIGGGSAALTGSFPVSNTTWRAEAITTSTVSSGDMLVYAQCG